MLDRRIMRRLREKRNTGVFTKFRYLEGIRLAFPYAKFNRTHKYALLLGYEERESGYEISDMVRSNIILHLKIGYKN